MNGSASTSAVAVFDALPGQEVPVGELNRRLGDLWRDAAASGGPAPSAEDAKATQLNVVLHLGLGATPADAAEQFATLVRFSRRYPSRVVVLCPLPDGAAAQTDFRAKVYGECHLGKSRSDTRCVEFVVLSYPQSARRFLEDQVSLCLSTDLPLYYWAHRFSSTGRLADYQYLLRRARRVLIDSASAPADALDYPWPRPAALRDLAFARLLPLRQSLGQFLAGTPAGELVQDLRGLVVTHRDGGVAEARALAAWAASRLRACGAGEAFVSEVRADPSGPDLGLQFRYEGTARAFRWSADLAAGHGDFEARFSRGPVTLRAGASLLAPEFALAEAMFF